MKQIISVNRFKTSNIGDVYSSPDNYFDWLSPNIKYDVWKDNLEFGNRYKDSLLVLGGGGLIGNQDFAPSLDKLLHSNFRKKVVWGAGINTHDTMANSGSTIQSFLSTVDLVGIRDYGLKEYHWVPCSSCMHPLFEQKYKEEYDYVIYEHKNYAINITKSHAPRKNNRSNSMADVLKFLGSAQTVITNTYHGAYWATLLNKKVVIVSPFSNKFSFMKHKHIISTPESFLVDIKKAKRYGNALQECREANMIFANKVYKYL